MSRGRRIITAETLQSRTHNIEPWSSPYFAREYLQVGLCFGVGRHCSPNVLFTNYGGGRWHHSPPHNARGKLAAEHHNVAAGYTHPVVRTLPLLLQPGSDLISAQRHGTITRPTPGTGLVSIRPVLRTQSSHFIHSSVSPSISKTTRGTPSKRSKPTTATTFSPSHTNGTLISKVPRFVLPSHMRALLSFSIPPL